MSKTEHDQERDQVFDRTVAAILVNLLCGAADEMDAGQALDVRILVGTSLALACQVFDPEGKEVDAGVEAAREWLTSHGKLANQIETMIVAYLQGAS